MLLPFWVSLLLTICLTPVPTPALAQAPDTLIVTLHDAQGAPVPGVLVLVRDFGGQSELGRATTDADGQVTFASLPASEVRVVIQGTLADGTSLRQPGDDAQGVRCVLGLPPFRLALRAAPDGTVSPDPATMIALDPGVPYSAEEGFTVPTLVLASPIPPATLTALPTPGVSSGVPEPAPILADSFPLAAVMAAISMALAVAAILALTLTRRRR